MSNQRPPDSSGSLERLKSRIDELEKKAEQEYGQPNSWKWVSDVVRHIPPKQRALVAVAVFGFIALVATDKINPRDHTPYLIALLGVSALLAIWEPK